MDTFSSCEKTVHTPGEQREEHICWRSVHCTEQTCLGEINALVTRCVKCKELLEDYDYSPQIGAGKRMQ